MAQKFYETHEFKEVQKEWEQKLENEGLPDIEKVIGNHKTLKQSASNVYRQMEPTRREAKESYFRELSSYACSTSFDCEVDWFVMTLKADGAKITEICAVLWAFGMRKYRRTVRLIIRKYEERWGVRHWEPSKLKYHWKKKQAIP